MVERIEWSEVTGWCSCGLALSDRTRAFHADCEAAAAVVTADAELVDELLATQCAICGTALEGVPGRMPLCAEHDV